MADRATAPTSTRSSSRVWSLSRSGDRRSSCAARTLISLDVTRVRVERLCDITEEDARAEGIDPEKPLPASINGKPGLVHAFGPDAARRLFAALWDAINGDRGAWASNPWVLVFDFRRVRP